MSIDYNAVHNDFNSNNGDSMMKNERDTRLGTVLTMESCQS
jgi:hypothetical protein